MVTQDIRYIGVNDRDLDLFEGQYIIPNGIAYNAYVGMPEAKRTVVSNNHKNGTAAVEAGAYVAEIIAKILEQKASGVDLVK